jgi:hypothetical protein
MEGALFLFGLITFFASILVFLDWLGRRKGSKNHDRAA